MTVTNCFLDYEYGTEVQGSEGMKHSEMFYFIDSPLAEIESFDAFQLIDLIFFEQGSHLKDLVLKRV